MRLATDVADVSHAFRIGHNAKHLLCCKAFALQTSAD
jgi:hypothetical protein